MQSTQPKKKENGIDKSIVPCFDGSFGNMHVLRAYMHTVQTVAPGFLYLLFSIYLNLSYVVWADVSV